MLSGSESNSVIVRSCMVCPFLRGLGRHDARLERQHPRRNRYAPLSKNSFHYGAWEGGGQPSGVGVGGFLSALEQGRGHVADGVGEESRGHDVGDVALAGEGDDARIGEGGCQIG
jgi:hypothetical protein